MIMLTRISGQQFLLNADLIERVDFTPDTVVTLVDGKKYVVTEHASEVIDSVRRGRAETIALSQQISVGHLLPAAVDDDPYDCAAEQRSSVVSLHSAARAHRGL